MECKAARLKTMASAKRGETQHHPRATKLRQPRVANKETQIPRNLESRAGNSTFVKLQPQEILIDIGLAYCEVSDFSLRVRGACRDLLMFEEGFLLGMYGC